MKKILIFCFIIAAVYFGWRYAPENMKNKIRDGFDYIGLSKITATTFTKPIAWLKDKTMPENPVLSRALLIDQLAEKLDMIVENKSPKTAAEKAALESALKDSADLISRLREENPKSGIAGRTLEKIVDAVMPDPPAATTSCISTSAN
ncbi:MAG: hypothetical protein UY71_C0040G0002 [Parcubacteria group bacterium GW2011_GWB1_52_7]|nr:MAG: hypothetical protein UY71_C0040G0002 [Parcubacteria group bacterium GW2011_GWB1_52_7]